METACACLSIRTSVTYYSCYMVCWNFMKFGTGVLYKKLWNFAFRGYHCYIKCRNL